MRFIVLLTVLWVSMITYSQTRIGYTKADIREEFNYLKQTDISIEHNWISYAFPLAEVLYMFDKDNVCFATLIIPSNSEALQFYINKYNKEMLQMAEFMWVKAEDELNLYIDLMFHTDGTAYFYCHE